MSKKTSSTGSTPVFFNSGGGGNAIGELGDKLSSFGKGMTSHGREIQRMQKAAEFAASLHAHNEGISHHYAMERMSSQAQLGRENLSHAAGIVKDLPDHHVSMESSGDGGFKFNAKKAPASRGSAKPATKPSPAPAAETQPTVRKNARSMAAQPGAPKASIPEPVAQKPKTKAEPVAKMGTAASKSAVTVSANPAKKPAATKPPRTSAAQPSKPSRKNPQ